MTKPSFLLSFKKSNVRRFSSTLPDYIVLFNEQQVGRLLAGPGGYMGLLPDHTGHFLTFPEADIFVWDERRKTLNVSANKAIHMVISDSRRIDAVHETLDPQILRLESGDEEKAVTANTLFFAKMIFGTAFDVPWSFCTEIQPEPFPSISSAENISAILVKHTKPKTDLFEFLLHISKGHRPPLEDRGRNVIHDELVGLSQKPALTLLAQALLVWLEDAYAETLNGALHRFLQEIQERNVWASRSLIKDPDFEKNSRMALRVEDMIAGLRDVPKVGTWKHRAQDANAADLGVPASRRLRDLLKQCDAMGNASPLRGIDEDLVSLFLKLMHTS